MKKVINTNQAPAAIGPYSQAVQAGNLLFVSGQLGLDPSTGEFVEGSVCRTVRRRLSRTLGRCHQDLAEGRTGRGRSDRCEIIA